MSLTPEQIKSKNFVVGLRGYDKDEVNAFLNEAAEALKQATEQGGSSAKGGPANGSTQGADADKRAERILTETREKADKILAEAHNKADKLIAGAQAKKSSGLGDGSDAFAKIGEQVAAVLRTAEEQASAMRADAEETVNEAKREAAAKANEAMVEADRYAADTKANAEAAAATRQSEADADRTAAGRALSEAQDQALVLVADAQKRADRMLEATRDRARAEAEEALGTARTEYARIRQHHAETSEKLRSTHDLLGQAISSIGTLDENDVPEAEVVTPDEPEAATEGRPEAESTTDGADAGASNDGTGSHDQNGGRKLV